MDTNKRDEIPWRSKNGAITALVLFILAALTLYFTPRWPALILVWPVIFILYLLAVHEAVEAKVEAEQPTTLYERLVFRTVGVALALFEACEGLVKNVLSTILVIGILGGVIGLLWFGWKQIFRW